MNAARVVAATGGSTNAALHLPAMAHEAGIDFDLFDVAEAFKSTPYIADLKPGGQYVAKDMYEAGGVYMLMKTMLADGLLDGNCMTVTGRTLGENIDQVTWNPDQKVIYDVKTPITPTGGVVGLRGTLAPDGAIVKVAGMHRLQFAGPARVFDCEEDCFAAVEAREIVEGEVIVIRYEGPKGGPGMREMLSTTAALYGLGMGEKVALITDGRFSGATRGLLHRPCRPGSGGRRADRAGRGRRHDPHRCRGRDDRLARRRRCARRAPRAWQPRVNDYQAGALWRYSRTVGPACQGAVTHPGAKAGAHVYAESSLLVPVLALGGLRAGPERCAVLRGRLQAAARAPEADKLDCAQGAERPDESATAVYEADRQPRRPSPDAAFPGWRVPPRC